MPLTSTTLGQVLLDIYSFDPGAAIYLPVVERYEAETPCLVAVPTTYTDEEKLHHTCLNRGFKNWLNVAVVSDTCDAVMEKILSDPCDAVLKNTVPCLIATFNDDCQEGGWLRKMMNYRHSDSSPRK
jgi:hypothetical protein